MNATTNPKMTREEREKWAAILGAATRNRLAGSLGPMLTDRQKRLFDRIDWPAMYASDAPDIAALLRFRYGLDDAQLAVFAEGTYEVMALIKNAGPYEDIMRLAKADHGPLWPEPVPPEVEAVDAMTADIEGAWFAEGVDALFAKVEGAWPTPWQSPEVHL